MASLHLTVRIVSDIICPWCYLGLARLTKALQLLQEAFPLHVHIQMQWVPYLLNPSLAPERLISRRIMYRKKFNGDVAKVNAMEKQINALFIQEGLAPYTLDGHVGSSLNAHRLVELAHGKGLQTKLMEVLFRKYHTEGHSPSQSQHLVDAGVEVGLGTRTELEMFVQSTDKINEIAHALQTNSHVYPMLSGVPHFRFAVRSKKNDTEGGGERGNELVHAVVPGAQDSETFVLSLSSLLRRAGYAGEVQQFAAAAGRASVRVPKGGACL